MSTAARAGWHGLAFLAFAVLAADQATKYAVESFTAIGSTRVLVPGLLNLVHTTNPGVAFGLLADSPVRWLAPVLIIFSVSVIVLLSWLLVTGRGGGFLGQWGLALILGGAAGNVLDRVMRRSVTDFIDFYVGSHHWYTFNLADSAIVVGAGSRCCWNFFRIGGIIPLRSAPKVASGLCIPFSFNSAPSRSIPTAFWWRQASSSDVVRAPTSRSSGPSPEKSGTSEST